MATPGNICNICGANLEYRDGLWYCPACGAYAQESITSEEQTLLHGANQLLRTLDFDRAENAFSDIILRFPQNSGAYWGRLCARFGIKFVTDYDGTVKPTCYAGIDSIIDDQDYLNALKYSSSEKKKIYESQASQIEQIRQNWLEKAKNEKPYDIFISFKDTDDETGDHTEDSVDVNNLFQFLSNECGYRVFFSPVSLRAKIGDEFEPFIFNAINTAKVMIVYGSNPNYFESPWVKNEWTRFLKSKREGRKKEGSLLVVCRNMNPSALPAGLRNLQALDANSKTFLLQLKEKVDYVAHAKNPNTDERTNDRASEKEIRIQEKAAEKLAEQLAKQKEELRREKERQTAQYRKRITRAIIIASIVLAVIISIFVAVKVSRSGKIESINAAAFYVGMDYSEVEQQIKANGFSNVKTVSVTSGWEKSGEVIKVLIDNTDVLKKKFYYPNREITVYYSSLDRIDVTQHLFNWRGKKYTSVVESLQLCGINVNVNQVVTPDASKKDMIGKISINGDSFENGDCYLDATARVEIEYYHHMVSFPMSDKECRENEADYYLTVVKAIQNAGFTNITLLRSDDLNMGWNPIKDVKNLFTKAGSVKSISINGDPVSQGAQYEPDSKIVIVVYTKEGEGYESITRKEGDPTTEEVYTQGEDYYSQGKYNEAFQCFLSAAEAGYAPAQDTLGDLYFEGLGVEVNYEKSVQWERRAAEQGLASAQSDLGFMYCYGYGVENNYSEAAKWYQKAAEQGLAFAQNELGELFELGRGVNQDYQEAASWYKRAADQGNSDAQANLGYLYCWGEGVKEDYAEAAIWFRKAADQGNVYAQTKLGTFYCNGMGVKEDLAEAVKWYRKAADQGYALAQTYLGDMYRNGRGISQNDQNAVDWYRKAAEQDYAPAQNNLGFMYANGYGVTTDMVEAVKWYTLSANQNYDMAQYNLGDMYFYGFGVKRDYEEAKKWYQKSADQGFEDAINKLAELEKAQ